MIKPRHSKAISKIAFAVTFAVMANSTASALTLDSPLYVMTTNHYAEALDSSSSKFGDLILIELIPGKEKITTGSTIPFFQGGVKSGSVKVERQVGLECDSMALTANVAVGKKIAKNSFSIATNSKDFQGHNKNERSLSKIEEGAILDLVMDQLTKQHLSITKEFIKLGANTVIYESGHPDNATWVGSLSAIGTKELVNIFLISDLKNGKFNPSFIDITISKDRTEGTDAVRQSYADHFSTKDSKFDKILSEVRGYESTAFKIYIKTPDGWKLDLTAGESGC